MFQSLTIAYDVAEDRILMTADLGARDSAAFWLTRRLTVALLERASAHVDRTSPLAARAEAHNRPGVAAFEREAALRETDGAVTHTPNQDHLGGAKAAAQRASAISIENQPDGFRMTVRGVDGATAVGDLARPVLQRVLDVLAEEAAKADWLSRPTAAAPKSGPAEPWGSAHH